jgi:hypothetical protein
MPQTVFQQSHHAYGTAPDNTPAQIDFNPPCMVLDLLILNANALVAFSSDGVFFSSLRLFVAGTIGSFNLKVQSMRIVNQTAGQVATYDVTGYYSPLEITGTPFEPVSKT